MCTLVSRVHMTFIYLQKGTQSPETRVHMTNLTRSDFSRKILEAYNYKCYEYLGPTCHSTALVYSPPSYNNTHTVYGYDQVGGYCTYPCFFIYDVTQLEPLHDVYFLSNWLMFMMVCFFVHGNGWQKIPNLLIINSWAHLMKGERVFRIMGRKEGEKGLPMWPDS